MLSQSFYLICSALLFITGARSALAAEYATGFEPPVFTEGLIPQYGWDEIFGSGESDVQSAIVSSGAQALRIASSATVKSSFPSTVSSISDKTLYIDGRYKAPAGSNLPDLSSIALSGPILAFDQTQGMMALDGDGAGGGTWIEAGIDISTDFMRLTVILDFENSQWRLYVNEIEALRDLGFKDNGFTAAAGLQIRTPEGQPGYLDDVVITDQAPAFITNHVHEWMFYE